MADCCLGNCWCMNFLRAGHRLKFCMAGWSGPGHGEPYQEPWRNPSHWRRLRCGPQRPCGSRCRQVDGAGSGPRCRLRVRRDSATHVPRSVVLPSGDKIRSFIAAFIPRPWDRAHNHLLRPVIASVALSRRRGAGGSREKESAAELEVGPWCLRRTVPGTPNGG